jgi:diamine N-acetyltransferase
MSLGLRHAEPRDLPGLVGLHQEVQELHVDARPDHFRAPSSAEVEARLRELLAASATRVWVAELGGEPVGYLVAITRRQPAHALSHERQWCELDAIAVTARHRGQGVGKALVEAAIEEARALGILQIELCSWAFNRQAHGAFEALGFEPKVVRFEYRR